MVCAHHVRADQVHIGSVASSTRSLQVSTPAGQAGPSSSQVGDDVAPFEGPALVAGSSGKLPCTPSCEMSPPDTRPSGTSLALGGDGPARSGRFRSRQALATLRPTASDGRRSASDGVHMRSISPLPAYQYSEASHHDHAAVCREVTEPCRRQVVDEHGGRALDDHIGRSDTGALIAEARGEQAADQHVGRAWRQYWTTDMGYRRQAGRLHRARMHVGKTGCG